MKLNKLSVLALTCAALSKFAYAQDVTSEQGSGLRPLNAGLSESPEYTSLDPVVVTGRPSGAQENAVSVFVVDGEEIERMNALRIGDVLSSVPGAFFSGLNGPRETPQIRSTLAFDNRTLFIEDGVPLQSSVFYDQSALGYSAALASPGSIEVLRGPGTALYGSDAFTGVIVSNTQAAQIGEWTGNLRARGGEYGLYDLAASVNAPIGQHQAWRVTGATAGEQGFRDQTAFQRSHAIIRHSAVLGAWSIDSLATFTESSTESATSIPLQDFEAGEISGSGLDPQVDSGEAEEEADYARIQSKITYNTVTALGQTQFELTSYLRSQEVASTLTFQPATTPRETADVDTFGLLPRVYLDHADGSMTIVGADLEFTDFDLLLEQSRPDAVVFGDLFRQGVQFDYNVGFNAYSPYLQHQRFLIVDQLTLTLGLRYDWLRYDFDNNLQEIAGDARLQVEDRVDSFSALSPKARLLWNVSDTQQLFFRYARGFRAPRASELYELEAGQAEFTLEPEIADSIEIGWRAHWLDGQLFTEIIGYRQVTRDGIITDVQTAAGNISVNAGERRFSGIELALQAYLPYGFDAQLVWAWQDFEYRQFGAEPGSEFDGNKIEEAPEALGQLTINWTPEYYDRVRLSSRLRYLGSWQLNPANTLSTDEEFIWTLLGDWRITDNFIAEFRIENVTDNHYAVFADAPSFAPAGRVRPGQPRTLSGGVKLLF